MAAVVSPRYVGATHAREERGPSDRPSRVYRAPFRMSYRPAEFDDMKYDVEVAARSTRTLRRMLSDFVDESAMRATGDRLVVSVVDQAALVTVIARLNDLGIRVEGLTRVRAE